MVLNDSYLSSSLNPARTQPLDIMLRICNLVPASFLGNYAHLMYSWVRTDYFKKQTGVKLVFNIDL